MAETGRCDKHATTTDSRSRIDREPPTDRVEIGEEAESSVSSERPSVKIAAQIEAELARRASLVARLRAEVESMESADSASHSSLQFDDDEMNRGREQPEASHVRPAPKLGDAIVQFFTDQMADVPQWRALSASSMKLYRAELDLLLSGYKGFLNVACGNKPHRPKDNERNLMIVEIKIRHPEYSFGQVARLYVRLTGKPMTAKMAERIHARTLASGEHTWSSILDRMSRATEA